MPREGDDRLTDTFEVRVENRLTRLETKMNGILWFLGAVTVAVLSYLVLVRP